MQAALARGENPKGAKVNIFDAFAHSKKLTVMRDFARWDEKSIGRAFRRLFRFQVRFFAHRRADIFQQALDRRIPAPVCD